MCVAYPAQVTAVGPDGTATVLVHGRPLRIALLAVAEQPIGPGDWLLVHSGLALARIDADEARARLALFSRPSAPPAGAGSPADHDPPGR
jgi:hydrogenase expression/formation protein HypC